MKITLDTRKDTDQPPPCINKTYTLPEVWGMWSLTFWKTIRANRAGPSNTAVSFLPHKHLVPKYTHNGSLYSAKIPAAWGDYQKYHPWFDEETALRTSICYWMTHLCSDTCEGSSRDSQFWPLVEEICCFSLSWMFGWMFCLFILWSALWDLDKPQHKCWEMLYSFPLW